MHLFWSRSCTCALSAASALANKLAQMSIQFLGGICARARRDATDHHIQAIRDFKLCQDVAAVRRFLGNFGWVRPHFPAEVVRALPPLTAQLKKGAVFPMPEEALKAQKVIQKLAERVVRLCVLDEVAAITQVRPLEQIADWSG